MGIFIGHDHNIYYIATLKASRRGIVASPEAKRIIAIWSSFSILQILTKIFSHMKHILSIITLTLIFSLSRAQVQFIAHRGESSRAPENTLAAFKLAWELNADGAELDIHLSKDHRIMVIHDGNTKRTTGKEFEIKDSKSKLIRKLDAGSFKDPSFRNEKIPFLEEVIRTIPPGKKLFIEIKCSADVLPWLKKLIQKCNKEDQLVFIAFDWQTIVDTKHVFPKNHCYWLCSNKKELLEKMDKTAAEGVDGLDLYSPVIDEELMSKAREKKLDVLAWTVDDTKEAKRLIDLGVIGITTNRTSLIKSQLNEK